MFILFCISSNDVWCFYLNSYRWEKVKVNLTLGPVLFPEPRYGQSQIELGEKHILILGKTFPIDHKIDINIGTSTILPSLLCNLNLRKKCFLYMCVKGFWTYIKR